MSKIIKFFREYSLLAIIFLSFFIPALFIQNRKLDEVRKKPGIYRDSLYLPSGKSIRLVSVGYDRFVADFIWLRTIQAFGGHWGGDRSYEPIYHLFDVITDLDPHFIEAYTFGNLVIGDEGGDQIQGLKLIDKGMLKNPRKYKLPYWAGYVAYWQLNDPELAKYYYTLAAKCSDAPNYINRILIYLELKSGRYHVAFEKYLRDWLESIDSKDRVVEGITSSRILDVINDWQMFTIREAVDNYVSITGNDPKTPGDLVKVDSIKPYPHIIVPLLQKNVEIVKNRPGSAADMFQDIMNHSIRKDYKNLPIHPRGYWYQLDTEINSDNEMFVVDCEELVDRTKRYLLKVRLSLVEFYRNEGHFPFSKEEIYNKIRKSPEPFGGEWVYFPFDGSFYSSTMPFL
jgi:hypothetical protein